MELSSPKIKKFILWKMELFKKTYISGDNVFGPILKNFPQKNIVFPKKIH